jgi:hypothetical protein
METVRLGGCLGCRRYHRPAENKTARPPAETGIFGRQKAEAARAPAETGIFGRQKTEAARPPVENGTFGRQKTEAARPPVETGSFGRPGKLPERRLVRKPESQAGSFKKPKAPDRT